MPRVRFLQTSDVHLRADRPERRRALELVFDAVSAHAADALIIAGDLFDRSTDAVGERARVRELVESIAPRPVVLLPGNHDLDAFGSGTDFGANAVVLADVPYVRASVCGVDVVGLPYQQGRTVTECLTGLTADPLRTALIAHATVTDAIGAFAGEGEDGAYMPVMVADLFQRFSYAALGHLHSGRNLVRRDRERLVAYAGSPVATSRREIGPRAVLLVDFEPGAGVAAHQIVPLGVPYYERTEVTCTPGGEAAAIDRLARQAAALRKPGVRVLARLGGVSTESEAVLREAATDALARASGAVAMPEKSDGHPGAVLELAVTSYAALANSPAVAEFVSRLTACDANGAERDPRLVEAALRIGLGAFLESLS